MFAVLQLKAVTALVLQDMGKPVIYLVNNIEYNIFIQKALNLRLNSVVCNFGRNECSAAINVGRKCVRKGSPTSITILFSWDLLMNEQRLYPTRIHLPSADHEKILKVKKPV